MIGQKPKNILKNAKNRDSNVVDSNVTTDETCPKCGSNKIQNAEYCPVCGCNFSAYTAPVGKKPTSKQRKAIAAEAARLAGGKVYLSTNDLTGLRAGFSDGLFESTTGRFSVTLDFPDINYADERDDIQADIFRQFCQLHSYLPASSIYQFNLVNFRHEHSYLDDILPEIGADAELARVYNEKILLPRLRSAHTDIERKNYFTVSVEANSADDAAKKLASHIDGIKRHFSRIGTGVTAQELSGIERMEVMHRLLRGPNEKFLFSYDELSAQKALTAKDYLAPQWAAYPYDDMMMRKEIVFPDQWVKVYHIRDFGSSLRDRAIHQIRSLPIPLNISLTFVPQVTSKVVKEIRQNIAVAQAAIMDYQKQVSRNMGDISHLPPALTEKEEQNIELLEFVLNKDQNISYFQGFITVYAPNKEKLAEYSQLLVDEVQLWFDLEELPERQEKAFTSSLPLASPRLDLFRSLTTAEGAALMPFDSLLRVDDPKSSLLLGQSSVNELNIRVDPALNSSPHMWVFGKTGSGKGMFMESMLTYECLLHPRTQFSDEFGSFIPDDKNIPAIYSFDFHAEYNATCEALGGLVSKLGPNHDTCFNPLDISSHDTNLSAKAVRENTDFFLALLGDVLSRPLTKAEASIVDEALQDVYEPHIGKSTRPILTDLYNELIKSNTREGDEIAKALALYTTGSMSSFNGETNVLDNPVWNNYDCSELGQTMQTFAVLSALQHIRRIARENNKAGRRTMVIIEECQILFDNDAAVRFLDNMFSEDRKYGLMIICVTQLPRRVLEHPRASHLFDNSGIFVFLSQLPTNQEIIANMFDLSESQTDCMAENTEPGSGLVVVEGLKMPMKNLVPEDNVLYELWNTDPLSIAAGGALDTRVNDEESEETENKVTVNTNNPGTPLDNDAARLTGTDSTENGNSELNVSDTKENISG